MILVVGTRPKAQQVRVLTMVCWKCTHPAAHRLTVARNYITLFFIPLIPLKARRTLQCLRCGAEQELGEEQAADILALPAQSPPGRR